MIIYIWYIMDKNAMRENDAQIKGQLDKSEVWMYDEITRYFREAGYSWKRAQKKTDMIMRCE